MAPKALEVHSPAFVRKYLLSEHMHLNERLRLKVWTLATFLSLSRLFWNLLSWTRSGRKGHAAGYGRASLQRFSESLPCKAPARTQAGVSIFPPPSVPASPPRTSHFTLSKKWVCKQLPVRSGTR